MNNKLETFLDKIMNLNVLRLGGAAAGIMGSPGTDNMVLESLKRSALEFAGEYKKPGANKEVLVKLSNAIYGYIQTLQVIYTLSEVQANVLTDELQALMNEHLN